MNYARWLGQQIAELDRLEVDPRDPLQDGYDLAELIDEASRRAAAAGLPEAVSACQVRPGPVGTELARRVLSACLVACRGDNNSSTLTVNQAAGRAKVAPDTVRDWIHAGKLKAANVGKGQQKGRYRIAPADFEAFMAARQPEKPAPRRRRVTTGFKRYS